jgi:hypothetical protein
MAHVPEEISQVDNLISTEAHGPPGLTSEGSPALPYEKLSQS